LAFSNRVSEKNRRNSIAVDLQQLATRIHEVCQVRGWSREWTEGGVYLHLEASEFIEAIRGKGDSPDYEEAADVLFVLLSMMAANRVSIPKMLSCLDEYIEFLKTAPQFKGERTTKCSTTNSLKHTKKELRALKKRLSAKTV